MRQVSGRPRELAQAQSGTELSPMLRKEQRAGTEPEQEGMKSQKQGRLKGIDGQTGRAQKAAAHCGGSQGAPGLLGPQCFRYCSSIFNRDFFLFGGLYQISWFNAKMLIWRATSDLCLYKCCKGYVFIPLSRNTTSVLRDHRQTKPKVSKYTFEAIVGNMVETLPKFRSSPALKLCSTLALETPLG